MVARNRIHASCLMDSDGALSPSVVIEVGCSETIAELRCDVTRWLESMLLDVSFIPGFKLSAILTVFQVKLVIIISIDPPIPPALLPNITIEHWKSAPFLNQHDLRTPPAPLKVASRVWSADWTAATTNYSLLLADVFGSSPIPPMYGANTHFNFTNGEVTAWRQNIIDAWQAAH